MCIWQDKLHHHHWICDALGLILPCCDGEDRHCDDYHHHLHIYSNRLDVLAPFHLYYTDKGGLGSVCVFMSLYSKTVDVPLYHPQQCLRCIIALSPLSHVTVSALPRLAATHEGQRWRSLSTSMSRASSSHNHSLCCVIMWGERHSESFFFWSRDRHSQYLQYCMAWESIVMYHDLCRLTTRTIQKPLLVSMLWNIIYRSPHTQGSDRSNDPLDMDHTGMTNGKERTSSEYVSVSYMYDTMTRLQCAVGGRSTHLRWKLQHHTASGVGTTFNTPEYHMITYSNHVNCHLFLYIINISCRYIAMISIYPVGDIHISILSSLQYNHIPSLGYALNILTLPTQAVWWTSTDKCPSASQIVHQRQAPVEMTNWRSVSHTFTYERYWLAIV